MLSKKSAKSMIGMPKVNWTCITSWIFSMPLDLISPKKFVSNMVKWTMLRKNTPNMMRYNFITLFQKIFKKGRN